MAQGGEFGFALLTLMLSDRLADSAVIQPLLAATVVSMVLSPLLIRHNDRLAELVFPRTTPAPVPDQQQLGGQRDHVIICGFGRVGQNLARVLERQGFVYVALDSDPRAVELARRAGDPVIFGDGTATEMLEAVGLERCRVLVLTFAEVDGVDEDRQGGARAAARTCRSWCALRTTRSSRSCSRPARPRSCPRRWKRA